jgi:hypothetical protein
MIAAKEGADALTKKRVMSVSHEQERIRVTPPPPWTHAPRSTVHKLGAVVEGRAVNPTLGGHIWNSTTSRIIKTLKSVADTAKIVFNCFVLPRRSSEAIREATSTEHHRFLWLYAVSAADRCDPGAGGGELWHKARSIPAVIGHASIAGTSIATVLTHQFDLVL